VALAAVALLLAGCGDTGASDASMDMGVSAEAPVAGDGMMAEGGAAVDSRGAPAVAAPDAATVTTRQVIRTGYLSMRAEEVLATAARVRGLVAGAGGMITTEDTQSTGESSYATITAMVPADRLDDFVADVSELGTVDSVNVSAQDVTSQVVDLDARIDALSTSISRLTQLLAQAERMEDLLAIETQLSQRQSELDALTAQRKYLADQVAMSTITVSIAPLTAEAAVEAPGFLSGLRSGWSAFVSVVMVAVTALGFFLPFLVILALIAVPLTYVLVRQARRRHRTPAAAPEAGSAPRP
jgi:hypothetical protein